MTIQVSAELRKLLEATKDAESLYLFRDAATGNPWGEQRLGHMFADIRTASKGRHLVLRALRHSCVIQLARKGSDVPEIASVTGHSPFTASAILAKYLPRDNALALKAQRRRGLVGTKRAPNV